MKLQKVKMDQFAEIKDVYINIIEKTPDMEKYARWKKGLHPTDEMIKKYISNGAMYRYLINGATAGAMAVTMEQEKDYHEITWEIDAKDAEVAAIHNLGVHPQYQNRRIGRQMIEDALQLARVCGKKAVRLDALASNIPTQKMYREKGFTYRGTRNQYAENTGWTDFYYYEFVL